MSFEPIYQGERMRVVAFASGSGTNFEEAVQESLYGDDSNFSVDLLVTDKVVKKGEPIGALARASKFDVDAFSLNGYRACGSWRKASKTLEGRTAYEVRAQEFNADLLEGIQGYERGNGFTFDLALLAGYMRLFKGPLLRRFEGRAINVHPADLTVRDGVQRRYVGDDAVTLALEAGESRTRSSIIMVDPECDAGAILVSGPWVNYTGGSADDHQDKQKRMSDWPALRFALTAFSNG